MSVDKYLHLTYDKRAFNCAHFVALVWLELTGQDIGPNVAGLARPRAERHVSIAPLRTFKRLQQPTSPCIVMLNRPRTEPHIGVYLRGKVLHITQSGVAFDFVEVAASGFKDVRYYSVTDSHNGRKRTGPGGVAGDADG